MTTLSASIGQDPSSTLPGTRGKEETFHMWDVPVEVVRTAHQILADDIPGKMVMFASVLAKEGKTQLMNNLAYAFGHLLGRKILVIRLNEKEGGLFPQDLPPNIAKNFAIQSTEVEGVERLLLDMEDSQKFKFIRDELRRYREQYDVILVEAPCVKSATALDPVILSSFFDQTLLVFQQQITPSDEIRSAIELFRQAGANDVKLLINGGSILSQKVAWWNFPARIVRMFFRLRVLWAELRSKFSKKPPEQPPTRPERTDTIEMDVRELDPSL
ncbi:MAG TPA: hypothetical protein DCE42_24425 [Myxococcales bacterium]|nr:hypothetical protein [Deltaproteobacteria bacterium]MBU51722.1 hypothetical protein [Deltaproteobacteria bacterium]HAA57933.1 hypothetical protein [Myxococcales bacterium]|tara:strand:+ start:87 stop:902 length:816 start_codon:yes stop_codon:yes gene_type:complete